MLMWFVTTTTTTTMTRMVVMMAVLIVMMMWVDVDGNLPAPDAPVGGPQGSPSLS